MKSLPVKLQERLFMKDHRVEIGSPTTSLLQAIFNCVPGKTGIMLPAGKSLLLRGSDNLPVADQTRRTVMIEAGNSQNSRHLRFQRITSSKPTSGLVGKHSPLEFDHGTKVPLIGAWPQGMEHGSGF